MTYATGSTATQGMLFPQPGQTPAAVHTPPDRDARGAVFTRPAVVDFILDLAGYAAPVPLHRRRLLEPAFGGGDFLRQAVGRLLAAWRASGGRVPDVVADLHDCVRAVELHGDSVRSTRDALARELAGHGVGPGQADALLDVWLVHDDFLLTPLGGRFEFVVGNPPYVRQERIDPGRLAEYRRRYATLYDRADLYVPFIERSLLSLTVGGTLGFICVDRWMKNRYGGPLRQLVAGGFHLRAYVDMVGTPAFQSDVIAYPAITVITRGAGGPTRMARRPAIDAGVLTGLARRLLAAESPAPGSDVQDLGPVAAGSDPWVLDSSDRLDLVRRLERTYPAIESAGCQVGIGVATGADAAFIGPFDALDVEADRKLPLVMTRDLAGGTVAWRGYGVVNPFAPNGRLVHLPDYPRLRRYLEARRPTLTNRHVARKSPANWYRTIDRIHPALAARPKLLVPDIKGQAHIVYEDGQLYPHHNLYFITSDTWDLRALRAVLMSGIARLFVATYSTRMRGGFLRFQAQYLRRIRLPRWADVPADLRARLVAAAEDDDAAECNRVAFDIYGLGGPERAALSGEGDHAD